MKNKLLFVLFCILSTGAIAQPTITDVASCSSYTLSASVVGGLPTDIGLYSDDSYSGIINIGFTFNYYGTNYTQCVIGENGMLTFDNTLAGGYDPWPISSALLGNSSALNTICGPWCDVSAAGTGTSEPIYTSLQGTAPNRTFAVTWCGVHMFDCTTQYITTQIIIYESTNLVEVHIGHKTICAAWNGGAAITGVQNASGTAATTAPGEDFPSAWAATNQAWRFTPVAPASASYTVASIPYAPIPYSTATVYWYDSTTGAYLGSSGSIVVTPTVTTTYLAVALGCSDSSKTYITLPGLGTAGGTGAGAPTIESTTFTNPSVCGATDGTVSLYGISPGFIDTIFESFNGVPLAPFETTAGPDSIITITGLGAGTYTFYYKINSCPSNTVTDVLVDPPVTAAFTDVIHLGCSGDSVIFTNGSAPAGYSSSWSFGDGSAIGTSTNPLHIYNDAPSGVGTYNITLTYQTSATDPACTSTSTQTVTFNHPLVASFTSDQNTVCLGVPITFTNASVGNGATYLWSFGDGSTETTTSPVHTYAAGGVYNVVLTVTDTIPCTVSTSESIDVVSIDVHTGVHDTSVCLADSMAMHAYVDITGSVTGVNYVWTPSANLGEPNDSVTNFFSIGNYTYLVTVTTAPLGCTASDTETIHSYPPVTITGLTASTTIPYGSSIQLNADGAYYFTWTPNNGTLDNPNINDPIATPVDTVTTYTVYGMSPYGCLDSASLTITLAYAEPEIVPSAFSPNNDGLNDEFRVTNLQYGKLVDFRVYNRWGQVIFQTADPSKGWDGTFNGVPQDIGTYNYTIIISHSDGIEKSINGTVTLIR